jgi:bifunctional non-homologous end joining protein LigD
VHVEDHPLDYAEFEGIIPEGQYGGGTVMVWDIGYYEVSGDDPVKAVEEGKLHLCLRGKKLDGEWTLVRTRHGTGHKDQWLLMKTGDSVHPVSKKRDDESALTSRTMKQIAAARDAEWNSNREYAHEHQHEHEAELVPSKRAAAAPRRKSATHRKTIGEPKAKTPTAPAKRKAAVKNETTVAVQQNVKIEIPGGWPKAKPEFIPPMKPKILSTPPPGEGWIYELKFDGYRVIAVVNEGSVKLYSRNEKILSFPEIREAVAQLELKNGVLDGEVVALDDQGRPSFQLLQAREMGEPAPICYYLFDILNLEGRDLRGLPLTRRKEILQRLMEGVADPLRFSDSFTESPSAILDQIKSHGLEGIIGKKAQSRYEAGLRSGAWVKVKCTNEQEFVIGGCTEPQGSRSYFGSVLVGYYEAGKLKFAGKVGTGFNEKLLASLYKQFEAIRITQCPFVDLPSKSAGRWSQGITPSQMKKCTWVKPELVCQVKFSEWTRDNRLRQPVFLGLRKDKAAEEVVREE